VGEKTFAGQVQEKRKKSGHRDEGKEKLRVGGTRGKGSHLLDYRGNIIKKAP